MRGVTRKQTWEWKADTPSGATTVAVDAKEGRGDRARKLSHTEDMENYEST